ncbi:hypothetical protein DC522_29850 [Microvirga sp. KLBC 81]|nr:hypothetical protein DC522_29850 [Microvirga sp. KLBC 81]
MLRAGCRCNDVAPYYGPAITIHNRYNRWQHPFGGWT